MSTKFYTAFNRPPARCTEAGDEFEILYDLTYGEHGEPILVPNGQKKPIRATIQAALNYGVVDLTEAYSRYLAGEDIQIVIRRAEELNPMKPFYGDFSDFPDNPLELINKLKKTAQNLPVDFKPVENGTSTETVATSEEKGSAENGT